MYTTAKRLNYGQPFTEDYLKLFLSYVTTLPEVTSVQDQTPNHCYWWHKAAPVMHSKPDQFQAMNDHTRQHKSFIQNKTMQFQAMNDKFLS